MADGYCTEDGCQSAARVRGLCTKHYARRGTCLDCGARCGVQAARCKACSDIARRGVPAPRGNGALDTDEFGTLAVCGYKGVCTWRQLHDSKAQAQVALKRHRARSHHTNYRGGPPRGGVDFADVNAHLNRWLKAHGLSLALEEPNADA